MPKLGSVQLSRAAARVMKVAMEQMGMHAEMNTSAEPQRVNPRDIAWAI
jgi:hypothetical protein